MPTATITAKGQVTIPVAVRVALGLHSGSRLDFQLTDDGFKVVPAPTASPSLKGRFAGRARQPVSLEAMEEAIAQEAARSLGRRAM